MIYPIFILFMLALLVLFIGGLMKMFGRDVDAAERASEQEQFEESFILQCPQCGRNVQFRKRQEQLCPSTVQLSSQNLRKSAGGRPASICGQSGHQFPMDPTTTGPSGVEAIQANSANINGGPVASLLSGNPSASIRGESLVEAQRHSSSVISDSPARSR